MKKTKYKDIPFTVHHPALTKEVSHIFDVTDLFFRLLSSHRQLSNQAEYDITFG